MSLADELLKAGLIDKKKVKQLKHEKRLEDKAKIEPRSQQADYLKTQQEKREQEKLLVQEERRIREEKEQRDRLKNLLLSNKISSSGNIRHYFVTRDQHILFLEISAEMSSYLTKGSHAIVEVMDTDDYVIVPISIAKKIEETAPEFVRFPKT
ncbi:MAG: DUF2058 family protein [Planctomycetota bacterium]